ncbi:hypothetical protein JTE90_016352 [Oedothorax gibbosus]|uniref:Uncharacterized protein n=1 Tax=Oedothorax gibbosus TaxID=931172 RepID=A0AAV6U800_9ARAC|nr:hypothetical protein JTE90_016352 [Oedothorax gibbosus]
MAEVSAQHVYYRTSMLCHQDVYRRLTDMRKALADLRAKSKKEVLEDTTFWKEEIEKVKEETKQAWQAKLDRLEARLASQEDELRRLQGETTTFCKTTENGRTDSAFEDDDERRPTTPLHQCRRVDCERMQRRLAEEEQRADQLNLMLNQKSIELNKLQIQLSKQTKEMIELEKSYLQLQCRLRRGTSKPLVSRLCSRASPFAPKNLKPPSPPPTTNGSTT